jgi:hypothetical protein
MIRITMLRRGVRGLTERQAAPREALPSHLLSHLEKM